MKKVKSIEALGKAVYVRGKAVYNVETMFSRLGHQQHGCSRRLKGWVEPGPSNPGRWGRLLEDGCQVCDRHVSRCLCLDVTCSRRGPGWRRATTLPRCLGSHRDCRRLASSFGVRLPNYTPVSKTFVLFNWYDQVATSAKDHEQTRRGIAKAVRLTPSSLLPCRQTILHNTTNKSLLNGILCGFPRQCNIQLVNKLDCAITCADGDGAR